MRPPLVFYSVDQKNPPPPYIGANYVFLD